MTACVAFPFETPLERSSGEKTLLAQLCIIKVESIPPVLAYKHNHVCEIRMAAQWHCSKSSLQRKHLRYNCSDQSGHKHWLKVLSATQS